VWDRLNERRHELIHLKRQQGFLEERDEMNFNALQWVAGLVRELVAGQPFQVNDNSTTTTPRATAFRPMCDDPECSVCKRMAELHAKNAPSVTGETTVEAALVELREMFPGKVIMVRREDSFYPPDCRDAAETNSMVTIKIGYLRSEPKFRSFRSLADCMAQVRAASRTEGSHEPIDSSQATHESNTSTLTPEGTARPKMI
jgi:hypothetical protein